MSLTRARVVEDVLTKSLRTDQESRVEELLNLVLRQMSQTYTEDGDPIPLEDLKKEHTFTVEDNDYVFDLPEDFIFTYSTPEIHYETDKGHPLIKLNIDDFKRMFPNIENNNSSNSRPTHYAIDRNKIFFGPKADDEYAVKFLYTCLHPDVADDDDPILFGEKFSLCIRDGILAELFDDLDDFEKANNYMNRHLSLLRAIGIIERRNAKAVIISDVYN